MRKLLFKKSEAKSFDAHSDLKVTDYEFGFDSYNACVIELDGTHGPVKNNVSDESLYIIDGEITVDIEGEIITGGKGDIVVMPAGKWRVETGKATALAICNPPYKFEDEEFK